MPKESRKELIIQEALKLFSEKGFAAVSMRDLAESVGISVSTIYHYYESKQVLFRDMIAQANELTAKAAAAKVRVSLFIDLQEFLSVFLNLRCFPRPVPGRIPAAETF